MAANTSLLHGADTEIGPLSAACQKFSCKLQSGGTEVESDSLTTLPQIPPQSLSVLPHFFHYKFPSFALFSLFI